MGVGGVASSTTKRPAPLLSQCVLWLATQQKTEATARVPSLLSLSNSSLSSLEDVLGHGFLKNL